MQKLIDIGKEKGYLLYDEVHELLSPEPVSLLMNWMICFPLSGQRASKSSTAKIEVLPGSTGFPVKRSLRGLLRIRSNWDLTPGSLEKSNDPVRIYLREMGSVPLLTRAGEVVIAKCIERNHLTVLKSLSRSPVIVREIISLGDRLKEDPGLIKDILHFRDEELTDDKIERKLQETLDVIGRIGTTYKRANALRMKLFGMGSRAKRAAVRRARWKLGRTRVELSRLVRTLEFTLRLLDAHIKWRTHHEALELRFHHPVCAARTRQPKLIGRQSLRHCMHFWKVW